MKKKGFTLIELLAVIVILAIIALILTPVISNIIDSARKSAFKRTVDGVLTSAKYYTIESNFENINGGVEYPIEFVCNGVTCEDENQNKLTFKGEVPISGTVTINTEGLIEAHNLCNKYFCSDGTLDGLVISGGTGGNGGGTTVVEGDDWDFDEIDDTNEIRYQTFTVPTKGYYKIELWGASGASETGITGNGGAYTNGTVYLNEGEKIYVYVGEAGNNQGDPTFNGGGAGGFTNSSDTANRGNSGGGATDVRLVPGDWDDLTSLTSRIMVAAGSGGGTNEVYETAGEHSKGGTLIGGSGGYYSGHTYVNQNGKGGTQTAGGDAGVNHFSATGTNNPGTFGVGGTSASTSDAQGSGGGGGGYYGGGAGGSTLSQGSGQGGGGGSSYISGYKGCVAVTGLGNATPKEGCLDGTTDVTCSYHYSGKIFVNAYMKSGSNDMRNYSGTSFINGNIGNGKAKITYLGENITIIPESTWAFDYIDPSSENAIQTFTAPYTGIYMLEVWGAQGGTSYGGKGGYSTGEVVLSTNQQLSIVIGGTTSNSNGGYNGGGAGANYYGGGGATHIATSLQGSGLLSEYESHQDEVLIVAGGGGGGKYSETESYRYGGVGGGLTGGNAGGGGTQLGQGGTQTAGGASASSVTYCTSSPGSFGAGSAGCSYASGGGGGWYGGSGGARAGTDGAGGGGSGYIGTLLNANTIAGNSTMPTHDGTTTMTGNTSNGYAKITYIGN